MRNSEEDLQRASYIGDPTNRFLERDLDTVGNGTGTIDQSTTADIYYIAPPATEVYLIDEVKLTIFHNALATGDNWGGIAALANGCLMRVVKTFGTADEVVRNFTPVGLKTHYELAKMFDVSVPFNNVDSLVVGTYRPPMPISLNGSLGMKLAWEVRDDLTAIVRQVVSVKGRIVSI